MNKSGKSLKPTAKPLSPCLAFSAQNPSVQSPAANKVKVYKIIEAKPTASRNVGSPLTRNKSLKRKTESLPHSNASPQVKREEKTVSIKTRVTTNPSSNQEPSDFALSKRNNLLSRIMIATHKKPHAFFKTLNGSTNDCFFCTKQRRFKDLIQANLNHKYLTSRAVYNAKIINDIVFNENTHISAVFKDYLLYDDINENLRRLYQKHEAKRKLKRTLDFYEKYYKVFPNYAVLDKRNVMLLNIAEKQQLIDEKRQYEAEKRDKEGELEESSVKDKIFTTKFLHDLNKESRDSFGKLLDEFIAKDSLDHKRVKTETKSPSITKEFINEVKEKLAKYSKTQRNKSVERCRVKRISVPLAQSRNNVDIKAVKLWTSPKRIAFSTIQQFVKPLGKSLLRQASQELKRKRGKAADKCQTERKTVNKKQISINASTKKVRKRSASVMNCEKALSQKSGPKVIDLAALSNNLRKQNIKFDVKVLQEPMKFRKTQRSRTQKRTRGSYLDVVGEIINHRRTSKAKVAKLEFPCSKCAKDKPNPKKHSHTGSQTDLCLLSRTQHPISSQMRILSPSLLGFRPYI